MGQLSTDGTELSGNLEPFPPVDMVQHQVGDDAK